MRCRRLPCRETGFALAVLGCTLLLCFAMRARAYPQYSEDREFTNCGFCHGPFRAPTYSEQDGEAVWPDGLHDTHRYAMLDGDCETCHGQGPRFPVMTAASSGGAGLSPISCVGCHGRAQDGTGQGTRGYGAGLRQHHWNSGVPLCADCHSDAIPANKTVVGEHVLPPYYANPGTGHNISTSACDATEDYAGDAGGLDNDGDDLYEASDPSCLNPVSTPGETAGAQRQPLRVTAYDGASGVLSLTYGAACAALDNNLVYGDLSGVSTYAYTGAACSIGNTGAFDWLPPGGAPSHLFLLIVGHDGSVEGSYGRNSAHAERPPHTGLASCGIPQDLSNPCP